MVQEKEMTLKALYRYYSYVQLNKWPLLLTSATFAPQLLSVYSTRHSTFLVYEVGYVCVWSPAFSVIISIIPKISPDCSVDKSMKDADNFFFYAIDLWSDSNDIIRYPTSPYCEYPLINTFTQ